MDDLPDELVPAIEEHVVAARAEWEMWLRDREEQRLWRAMFGNAPL